MLYKLRALIILLISSSTVYSQMVWMQPEKSLIIVTNDLYQVSQVYDISLKHNLCILDKPNSKSMKNRFLDASSVKHIGDKLFVKMFPQSFSETFRQLDALPRICDYPLETSDVQVNFNVLWQFFDEYYPSFKERFPQTENHWQNVYGEYAKQINTNTSNYQLYKVMADMLSILNDGHVELYPYSDDIDYVSPTQNERSDKTSFMRSFQRSYEIDEKDIGETNRALSEALAKNFFTIDNLYLSDVRRSEIQTESDENTPPQSVYTWGVFKQQPKTAYIRILQELYYAGDDPLKEQYFKAELTIDKIIDYLRKRKINRLVLDLRYNVGGIDAVNHYLVRHLLDKKRAIKQQISHYQGKWTRPKTFYLKPFKKSIRSKDNLFPIIVLTSMFTSSSGEDLTLELKSLPMVTQWGYKTNGIFADTHTRVLPNGWVYQLPFNKNLSGDGTFYEFIGIPPEVPINPSINYLNKEFINQDKDFILDAILTNNTF